MRVGTSANIFYNKKQTKSDKIKVQIYAGSQSLIWTRSNRFARFRWITAKILHTIAVQQKYPTVVCNRMTKISHNPNE